MSAQSTSAGEGDRKALASRLWEMVTQYWVPQALYVAVMLGIAERRTARGRARTWRFKSRLNPTGCAACCEP